MKKLSVLFLFMLPFMFAACGGSKNKQKQEQEKVMVGNDKDEHGCIGSAGYVWSDVLQECIRTFESGLVLAKPDNANDNVHIIFSADSTQVELFFSDDTAKQILDRRGLENGYVWNQEDDDTFNLRQDKEGWPLEKRQERIYSELKKEEVK